MPAHVRLRTIGDVFQTPVAEKISPVIKVGETDDERKLAAEIGSYVVTPLIEKHLDTFLEHYTDTLLKDTDEIGVWISGYFGSGKSHFAKILQLAVENRMLIGERASRRLMARVPHDSIRRKEIERAASGIDKCDTRVLAFNLNTLVDSKSTPLSKLLLSQHYQTLGYSSNILYARVIERELDRHGRLELLHRAAETRANKSWAEIQSNLTFNQRAIYEAACEVAPDQFHSTDEVRDALTKAQGEIINPQLLVRELLADLEERRARTKRPQRALLVLDESGQWIENSADRLSQLQALVEEAAVAGRGRLWLIVTTHGDIASIYQEARALEGDMKKIEGRFFMKPALTTENIELVLEERLFRKKVEAEPILQAIYDERDGILRDMGQLANTTQTLPPCTRERFVTYFPFFPYQVHLIPEIVKSLRSKGGRGEQMTGSTRTLLAITQDILRTGRRGFLESDLRTLVSFDEVYENLVGEGEVSPDVRTDISRIKDMVPGATPLTTRVAEVLYLIRELAYVPRTKENVARLLMEHVDEDLPTILARVEPELERLVKATRIARVGEEYEFLTGERRTFEEEVASTEGGYRFPDKQQGLVRHFVHDTNGKGGQWRTWLGDNVVAYKGREFTFRLQVDDYVVPQTDGAVTLRFVSPLSQGDRSLPDLENETLKKEFEHTIFFLPGRVNGFDRELARAMAMREVVQSWKGDQRKAQDARQLAMDREANDVPTLDRRVTDGFREGIRTGHVIYKGGSQALTLNPGQKPSDALRADLAAYWPQIFPKFDKVPERVQHDQRAIEAVLTGSALPADVKALRLHDASGHLDPNSPLVEAIRVHLLREQAADRRVLGKGLLDVFTAPPYGWDGNAVRVGVAALVRAGVVKLVINKKPYTNPADPDVLDALKASRAFDKAELVAEDADLGQEVLTETRAFLIKVTKNRKLDETPAALSEAAEDFANELLERAERVRLWAQGSQFPVSIGFSSGVDAWNNVVELPNPIARVKTIHASRTELAAGEAAIVLHGEFQEASGAQYVESRHEVSRIEAVEHRLNKESAPAQYLASWRAAQNAGSLIEKATWKQVQALRQSAVLEITALVNTWRDEARSVIDAALKPLPETLTREGLDASLEPTLAAPLMEFALTVDAVTAPVQAAALSDRARQLVRDLDAAIAAEVASRRPPPAPGRQVTRVRLRDVAGTRRISKAEDWDDVRSQLDARIRTLIDQNYDIEFD
jgi:hypothetical protein